MASNDRIVEMLNDIHSATTAGKLRWSETAEPDEFVAVMSGAKFTVRSKVDSGVDPEGDYYEVPHLELHRREDDALLLSIRPNTSIGISYQVLNQIHDGARHRALGVDDAIDEVLDSLRQL